MNNTLDRRRFLQLMASAPLLSFAPTASAQQQNKNKILLLVELKGGNDALNTLVPYEDSNYYRLRPKLGIKANDVLKLGNGLGMHPSMKALLPEWQAGDMAWVQGIGYPQPNHSHFRSIEIWETASQSNEYLDDGWVAQLYAPQTSGSLDNSNTPSKLQGVTIGSDAGPLNGNHFNGLLMQDKQSFISLTKQIKAVQSNNTDNALSHVLGVQNNVHSNAQIVTDKLKKAPSTSITFPKNKFGRQLETTAKIILSGMNVPVYKVELGSFDTHNNQAKRHAKLLSQLSEGLASFSSEMKKAGLWDDVLIVTYSEFGRRAIENKSGGTDHGTAAAHFALGGRVSGGVHKGLLGQMPSMTDLDKNDLKFTTDFRSYYHTIATQWMGVSSLWENQSILPLIDT
ncbi:MAG: DUF1501 domain-containing protein [Cocleimonas sp.]